MPQTTVLAPPSTPRWTGPLRRLALFVWLGLMLLTLGVGYLVYEQDQALFRQHIDAQASELQAAVRKRLEMYRLALTGVAGLYLASDEVTREDFSIYVRNLRLDRNYPGVRGIGFARRIDGAGLAGYQQRLAEAVPGSRVFPAGHRDSYTAVEYTEPMDDSSRHIIGFDMYTEAKRQAAMRLAADSGEPAATGKVTLQQDVATPTPSGFLLYYPIYRNHSTTDTQARRREALLGWVYMQIRMDEMLAGILGQAPPLDLAVYDGRQAVAGQLITGATATDDVIHLERGIDFAQHHWLLVLQPTHSQLALAESTRYRWVLALGSLVSLLAAASVATLAAARGREQHMAAVATHEIRQREQRFSGLMESMPNAIFALDSDGHVTMVNGTAERWFGQAREMLIGLPFAALLVPSTRDTFHERYQPFFSGSVPAPPAPTLEWMALRADGSEFPIEPTFSAIDTGDGRLILASMSDISSRKRSEARFRLVVEAAPNAVVVTDSRGVIELVNSQTEVWFGYSRQELLGQSVEILIPERFRKAHPAYRSAFVGTPQVRPMGAGRDLYGRRKNGSEFPIEIGLNPIQTDDGLLIMSSIIDISERKAAERRFREQSEQIAQASRYKSEFLANMSHELRTPLNSILILAEQLGDNRQGNLTAKQVEHAHIIHRSGNELLTLINDILDLSKIEAGRMTVQVEQLILADFAAHLRQSFAPLAEARKLSLCIEIDTNAPRAVLTDGNRLFQIVKNLISNAIKFTEQGGVHVRVARPAPPLPAGLRLEAKDTLAIQVVDTGRGIPADKQEQIFLAFHQLDGSTSRQYGGTGLGLTISKQLAQLLGGSITVDSKEGVGSTFTLYLPARSQALPEREAPAIRPAALAQHASGDPLVLIVEDDVNFAEIVAAGVRSRGLTPVLSRSGGEAVQLARQLPVKAIILDILLPDGNGWHFLTQLRELPSTHTVPVQVVSCLDQPSPARPDIVGYLEKPVDVAQLGHMLDELVEHIGAQGHPAPQPADTQAHGGTLLLVDDDIRNIYAMTSLLEDRGYEVITAGNGVEALARIEEREDIDLILMDIAMPLMDGFETTHRLRADKRFTRPIVALTAYAMKGDREKCLDAGADDYLAKPVSKSQLYQTLDHWLGRALETAIS
ncbi:CHASE domain-containing protein [Chitinivorax sp. PXF-14]|uniref:CHASE domain-containing protein n=1 Tax=Chitinivorax sp. PXF-14 TaxID=3230488 RepID=UPI003466E8E8